MRWELLIYLIVQGASIVLYRMYELGGAEIRYLILLAVDYGLYCAFLTRFYRKHRRSDRKYSWKRMVEYGLGCSLILGLKYYTSIDNMRHLSFGAGELVGALACLSWYLLQISVVSVVWYGVMWCIYKGSVDENNEES